MRSQKSCVKYLARHCPDSRTLLLQDSRVTIGATAKGRSSSAALNGIARGQLPYVIGGGLYLGGLHTSTDVHRADDPTRDRPIRAPCRPVATWLIDLGRRSYDRFDDVLLADSLDWPWSGWARLLVGLRLALPDELCPRAGSLLDAASASVDVEAFRSRRACARYGLRGARVGEASNPGPGSSVRRPRVDRQAVDLDVEAGLDYVTVSRRVRAWGEFVSFVRDLRIDFDVLILSGPLFGVAIKAFGVHLFRSERPQYVFEDLLNAAYDRHPHWRAFFADGWRLLRRWRLLEPGRSRLVIPAPLLRAMISVALLWGWPRYAGLLALGFSAMLHPSELFEARRRDLALPADSGGLTADIFLHIERPKTRRFARMQHGRVSDPSVVRFLVAVFQGLPMDERLAPLGHSSFRRRWDAILHFLQIPSGRSTFPTPGALRGSGATFFYIQTEDIPRSQWGGRWRRLETLEFYLQEVAARTLVNDLPAESRARVLQFAGVAGQLLSAFSRAGSPDAWRDCIVQARGLYS